MVLPGEYSIYGQEFSLYIDTGSYYDDEGWGMKIVDDHIVIISSTICEDPTLASCAGLVVTDLDGSLIAVAQHQFDLGPLGPSYGFGAPILALDSTIIYGMQHFEDNRELAMLFETSILGEEVRFAEIDFEYLTILRDFIATEDGYIVVGYASNEDNDEGGAVWFQLNEELEVVDYKWRTENYGEFKTIAAGFEESYIVGGSWWPSPMADGIPLPWTPQQGYIAVFNAEGEVLWERILGDEEQSDGTIKAFALPNEEAYIGFGHKDALDLENRREPYIYKFDSEGNELWYREFPLPNPYSSNADRPYYDVYDMVPTSDGGIVGVGRYTDPPYFRERFPLIGGPEYGGWIFKLDSEGQMLWEHIYYDTEEQHKGRMRFTGLDVFDSNIYAAGGSSDLLADSLPVRYSNADIWLLKVDENGCYQGDCHRYIDLNNLDTTPISVEQQSAKTKPLVYPTILTSGDHLQVSSNLVLENPIIRIWDQMGRMVMEQSIAAGFVADVSIPAVAPGVYIYHLYDEEELLDKGKLFMVGSE